MLIVARAECEVSLAEHAARGGTIYNTRRLLRSSRNSLPPATTAPRLADLNIELVVPLNHDGTPLGLLAFGPRITGDPYSSADLEYLGALANTASAVVRYLLLTEELKSVTAELDNRANELKTLFELGRALNAHVNTTDVANVLANTIIAEAKVDRCLVYTSEDAMLHLRVSRGISGHSPPTRIEDPYLVNLISEDSAMLSVAELPRSDVVSELDALGIAWLLPVGNDGLRGCLALGEQFTGDGHSAQKTSFLLTLGSLSLLIGAHLHQPLDGLCDRLVRALTEFNADPRQMDDVTVMMVRRLAVDSDPTRTPE